MADSTKPYHFIMTVQYQYPARLIVATRTGTWNAAPGTTREEVFQSVQKLVAESSGQTSADSSAVLFYSLEPDEPLA
ncbi:hypothetical protein [Streptomyces sp. CB03911]|uniref:hypothetical protein n=1 Tax=Streptomyces sp. CB03911 TaxID=1804758 RepID=UPI00093DD325|nr:hypothetical protein [Streptomyces sp. CB03911]OKI19259.1 hypothetical protein A6A07_07095 [Streptomyces sp. CB03911]